MQHCIISCLCQFTYQYQQWLLHNYSHGDFVVINTCPQNNCMWLMSHFLSCYQQNACISTYHDISCSVISSVINTLCNVHAYIKVIVQLRCKIVKYIHTYVRLGSSVTVFLGSSVTVLQHSQWNVVLECNNADIDFNLQCNLTVVCKCYVATQVLTSIASRFRIVILNCPLLHVLHCNLYLQLQIIVTISYLWVKIQWCC